MLLIEPIPCLRDNYAYLLHDLTTREAWVVDPSEPDAPAQALARRGCELRGILATHHHLDHVGGVEDLVRRFPEAWVAGHASDRGRIPAQSRLVEAPQERWLDVGLELAGRRLLAMHIPGHTSGAIAWRLEARGEEPDDVFTGDTLFGAGCGRLFEGTPAQMHASLRRLVELPPATRMWFGHEYTAANLRFAAHMEPDNEAVRARAAASPVCSTPTTVAAERATNPFVRAETVDELARRRRAKDDFR